MSSAPTNEGRTLWMGAIQPHWDETYIGSLFQSTGSVQGVRIIRHANPLAPGYAFIEFTNHSAAKETLDAYHGRTIPGTSITFRLNWGRAGTANVPRPSNEGASLFVGDLAPEVTSDMLFAEFCSRYPSCTSAKVIMDAGTGQPKGYGFVKFSNEIECQRAIEEMNGAKIGSRAIRTGTAQSRAAASANQKAFMNANLQNPYVYPAPLGAFMQLYASMGIPNTGGLGTTPIPQVYQYAAQIPRPPLMTNQWQPMYQPGMMVQTHNQLGVPVIPSSPVHSFQGAYNVNNKAMGVTESVQIQTISPDQTKRINQAKTGQDVGGGEISSIRDEKSARGNGLEQPANEQPDEQLLGAESAIYQEDTLEESFNIDVSNQAYIKLHSHNGTNGFSHTSTENRVDLESNVSDSEEQINETQ